MRALRAVVGVGLGVVVILAGAAAASAHVTVDPDTAAKGAGDQVLTFRVPNEMDDANTISLKLQLPPDHPIAAVDVLSTAGWTSQVDMVHLANPIQTDDGAVTDVPSVITWTGGQIKPGEYGEFKILAMGLPADTDSLTFKTIQGYDNNQEVSWIDESVAGQPAPDHPAPVLTLTAASADQGSASATTTTSSSSSSSNGLGVTGIVVGAVGLIVAVIALARTRKRSVPTPS